jgi:mannosyl-3-phosphoglycerate synthase
MLVARVTGFESDIIQTSNAGEHAMTVELAERLTYSSGFSIEPYEIVHLLENYTGIEKSPPFPEILAEGVEVFQVEPRNPHIHEERGEEHIPRMMAASLGTIYHSRLADEELRARIVDELIARRALKAGEEPPKPSIIPPFKDIDVKKVLETIEAESDTLAFLED